MFQTSTKKKKNINCTYTTVLISILKEKRNRRIIIIRVHLFGSLDTLGTFDTLDTFIHCGTTVTLVTLYAIG